MTDLMLMKCGKYFVIFYLRQYIPKENMIKKIYPSSMTRKVTQVRSCKSKMWKRCQETTRATLRREPYVSMQICREHPLPAHFIISNAEQENILI